MSRHDSYENWKTYDDRRFNQSVKSTGRRLNYKERLQAQARNQGTPSSLPSSHPLTIKMQYRRDRIILTLIYCVILLVMVAADWFLLPFNKVNSLEVSGNQTMTARELLAVAQLDPYDSYRQAEREKPAIEKRIKAAYPAVKRVSLHRPSWRQTQLVVGEYPLVAFVEDQDQVFGLLANGSLIYQTLQPIEGTYPSLESYPDQESLAALGASLEELDAEVLAAIESLRVLEYNTKDIQIQGQMKDGNQVSGLSSTFGQKMNRYFEMKESVGSQLGSFHLEVANYFVPYSQSSTE